MVFVGVLVFVVEVEVVGLVFVEELVVGVFYFLLTGLGSFNPFVIKDVIS